MGILVFLTFGIIATFLMRKKKQVSKINNIVYVTQALILLSYLCKHFCLNLLARLLFFLDMSVWKFNACAFNLLELLPTIFTSMAYSTYIGNWMSLTLALSIASDRRVTWKHTFLRKFRPGLYIFLSVYFVFTVTVILTFCHSPIPVGLIYVIQIFQSIVLIQTLVVGPLLLRTLNRKSKYLY